jgi:hypothetical protein
VAVSEKFSWFSLFPSFVMAVRTSTEVRLAGIERALPVVQVRPPSSEYARLAVEPASVPPVAMFASARLMAVGPGFGSVRLTVK